MILGNKALSEAEIKAMEAEQQKLAYDIDRILDSAEELLDFLENNKFCGLDSCPQMRLRSLLDEIRLRFSIPSNAETNEMLQVREVRVYIQNH